jgi:hypothetical protein
MNDTEKNTLQSYITDLVEELSIDVVELSEISFIRGNVRNISNKDFKKYLYDAVMALMKAGAVPAMWGKDGYMYGEIDTFGKNPEDIAKNVSNEWPYPDNDEKSIFDMGTGLYFVRPDIEQKYVKRLRIKAD